MICACSIIFIYIFIKSQYVTLGFYQIKDSEWINGNYYITITFLSINFCEEDIRLKCDDEVYDLVKEHKNAYFEMQFVYNAICPNKGFLLNIEYDEDLTKYYMMNDGAGD